MSRAVAVAGLRPQAVQTTSGNDSDVDGDYDEDMDADGAMDEETDSAAYRAQKDLDQANDAAFKSICPREELPFEFEHASDDKALPPEAVDALLRQIHLQATLIYSPGTVNNIYASCARYFAWNNNRLCLPHLPGNWDDWGMDKRGNRLDPKTQKTKYMTACCNGFKAWWATLSPSELPVLYVPNQLIEEGKMVPHSRLLDKTFRAKYMDPTKEARLPRNDNPFKDPSQSLGIVPLRMTPDVMHKGFVNGAVWSQNTNAPTVLDPRAKMAQGIRALYQVLEPYAAQLRATNRPYSDLVTNEAFMAHLAETPPMPNKRKRR